MTFNIADIIILAVFTALMILAASVIVRNKKAGKSACGCGGACSSCTGCPHAISCALPEKRIETDA